MRLARRKGLRAIVLKNHYEYTSGLAYIAQVFAARGPLAVLDLNTYNFMFLIAGMLADEIALDALQQVDPRHGLSLIDVRGQVEILNLEELIVGGIAAARRRRQAAVADEHYLTNGLQPFFELSGSEKPIASISCSLPPKIL